MDRREFLRSCVLTTGAVCLSAASACKADGQDDPLEDFYQAAERVLKERFGEESGSQLVLDTRRAYQDLSVEVPYIGGEENIFTEWLDYGVFYLALYRALTPMGQSVEKAGRIIYETYWAMADYPRWLISLVGKFRYNDKYVDTLRAAALLSQERRYEADFVCTFVEGDGEAFDYGLDIHECAICKFYQQQGAAELAPYLCLSDEVVSVAFNRGLVRYKTLAEGDEVCDFRYKKGCATYVEPLRDGWPPQFAG